MDTRGTDLFGDPIDVFAKAKDRYGVWPVTVWDCDKSNRTTQKLKAMLQESTARDEAVDGTFGYQSGASVFDPAVAAWLLNCYAPNEGVCIDPFAGGGTRAVMAAKHGLEYVGIELRPAEVQAVEDRCFSCDVADRVTIVCGDARDCTHWKLRDGMADFLLTCPPYWNLEKYGGGANDLSEISNYAEFCKQLGRVVYRTFSLLKHGAYSCWVVGLHRDASGALVCMNHDVAAMHRDAGFRVKEEIILAHRNNGAIQRVGQFDKGDRRLVRTHEYALVFTKP